MRTHKSHTTATSTVEEQQTAPRPHNLFICQANTVACGARITTLSHSLSSNVAQSVKSQPRTTSGGLRRSPKPTSNRFAVRIVVTHCPRRGYLSVSSLVCTLVWPAIIHDDRTSYPLHARANITDGLPVPRALTKFFLEQLQVLKVALPTR